MSASLPAEKSADFAISDGTRDTGSCNTWDAQLYSASVRSWCEEHGLQDPNPTRGGLGLLREVVSESRNTKSTLKQSREDKHGHPKALPCITLPHGSAGVLFKPHFCSIRLLPGIGFNPSLVAIDSPTSQNDGTLRALRKLQPDAAYVGVTRILEEPPQRHHCKNNALRFASSCRPECSLSDMVLLDAQFRVLKKQCLPIPGGLRSSKLFSVVDARLLPTLRGDLGISFYALRNGVNRFFLGVVDIDVEPSDAIGGFTANATKSFRVKIRQAFRLKSPRNGGLVVSGLLEDGSQLEDGAFAELFSISPKTVIFKRFRNESGAGKYLRSETDAPAGLRPGLSNSINPLWVPELDAYFCLGHWHVSTNLSDHRSYYQVAFTLDRRLERVTRYSAPFFLPDIHAGDTARLGFRIQFLMSATRVGESVLVAYGVNGCSSAALSLTVTMIDSMLRYGSGCTDDRSARTADHNTLSVDCGGADMPEPFTCQQLGCLSGASPKG